MRNIQAEKNKYLSNEYLQGRKWPRKPVDKDIGAEELTVHIPPMKDHNDEELNDQCKEIEDNYEKKTGKEYKIKGKTSRSSVRWKNISIIYNSIEETLEEDPNFLGKRGYPMRISEKTEIPKSTVYDELKFMKRNNLIPKKEDEKKRVEDKYNYPYFF